jgi:hypothetical protein
VEIAMPTKVVAARRRGFLRLLFRKLRLAIAFVLSAMLSYCGVGDLTGQNAPTESVSP